MRVCSGVLYLAILAYALCASSAIADSTPTLRGEDTELRRAILAGEGTGLDRRYLWTWRDAAVTVEPFSALGIFGRPESLKQMVPWAHLWVEGFEFARIHKSQPAVVALMRRATYVLIHQTSDLRVCVINVLSGSRVFQEGPEAQKRTAKELPCSEIHKLSISSVPAAALVEIEAELDPVGDTGFRDAGVSGTGDRATPLQGE